MYIFEKQIYFRKFANHEDFSFFLIDRILQNDPSKLSLDSQKCESRIRIFATEFASNLDSRIQSRSESRDSHFANPWIRIANPML